MLGVDQRARRLRSVELAIRDANRRDARRREPALRSEGHAPLALERERLRRDFDLQCGRSFQHEGIRIDILALRVGVRAELQAGECLRRVCGEQLLSDHFSSCVIVWELC